MDPFVEFAIILGIASIFSVVFNKLKQPTILGYILTGVIIGVFTQSTSENHHLLESLGKFGVTFLLFVLGLELDLTELRKLGKVAFLTGIGQIVFTFTVGWLLSVFLGFDSTTALYVGIGLSFSSTIVIVKLLSQKNQIDSLFGRISIGFLLVQDFVAIFILIALSVSQSSDTSSVVSYVSDFGIVLLKGIVTIIGVYLFVKYILNRILDTIKGESEILFLVVISWALVLSSIMGSKFVGFSIEIGAIIAGISISTRFESLQIESWTKPLRDFFIILFFVALGIQIDTSSIDEIITPAIVMSLLVLVGNPIIVIIIMRLLGYKLKTAFLTSLAVAQISEFSLIIAKLGYDLGYLEPKILTLMTIVGGITMTLSSLMIYFNEQIFEKIKRFLWIFEMGSVNKELEEESEIKQIPNVIMFGCHRMGERVIKGKKPNEKHILIIDMDPINVKKLKAEGFNAIFGDMSDQKMYSKYGLETAEIVISTVPSRPDNLKLMKYIQSLENKPMLILTTTDDMQASEYYKNGVDIVIYPHFLGANLLSKIIAGKVRVEDVREEFHGK